MANILAKISPTAYSVSTGSFKAAAGGLVGGAAGYYAWKKFFRGGQGHKAPGVGVVAGITAGEMVMGGGSALLPAALGVVGAVFLPKFLKKVVHIRGEHPIAMPVAGYIAGKGVASLIE